MRRPALLLLSITLFGSSGPQTERRQSYIPPDGFVPDSATAARIAEAIWIPIYGEAQVRSQRPYRATLRKGVWTVRGTLRQSTEPGRRAAGGVAVAEISKRDARVLRVSHGR
jgi:hypothetical protein